MLSNWQEEDHPYSVSVAGSVGRKKNLQLHAAFDLSVCVKVLVLFAGEVRRFRRIGQ